MVQRDLSRREGRSVGQKRRHPERTKRPASESNTLQRDIARRDKMEEEVVKFTS